MDTVSDRGQDRGSADILTRVMGLDVGRRRTGVALSDLTRLLAQPLTVIEQRGRDRRLPEVADLVQEHNVGLVVIGYPLHMDGTAGRQAGYVKAYAQALERELAKRSLEVDVVLWDERLSTAEASEIMREQPGGDRDRDRALDAVAAAVILRDYLDHQKTSCPS